MGLKDQMSGIIPEDILIHLSDHFDVVGDIAILQLREGLAGYHEVLARAIIARRHTIKTVLNKTSRTEGCNRTAHYEIISGTDTVTSHREYGFTYEFDVMQVFFNPRLATERKRVTDQVKAGESLIVPFCGVGPFMIPAAARGAHVVGVEQNPVAFAWLVKNAQNNGVENRVAIIQGDAFDTSLLPHHVFDRAIIPTPYGMDTIFDTVAALVKPGGIIHFYTFKNRYQADNLVPEFRQKGFLSVKKRQCGNVAPGVSRWVFDLIKRKEDG